MNKYPFLTKRYILLAISSILLLGILIFKLPNFIKNQKLDELGYDQKSKEIIFKHHLTNKIINNKINNPIFKENILKDDFNPQYFDLYTVTTNINQDSFLLYDTLLKKGYTNQELLLVFEKLKNIELRALLVFPKLDQAGLNSYIEDCLNHPNNNDEKLELKNKYIVPYSDIKEREFENTVLVNTNNALKSDQIPDLVKMDVNYATEGLKLNKEAYEHFTKLCKALIANKLKIYATDGFRLFDEQKTIYDSFVNADAKGISRPRHSDLHTGLSVLVTSYTTSGSFKNSPEYKWLIKNAHKFGFIFRYPSGKETLTLKDADAKHLRYVGQEASELMFKQKLTLEEYHYLYKEYTK